MSISGILESLATYYKERMFGKIHELTFNTENALFDGLTATNRPPLRKTILESVNLDLSNQEEEQSVLYNIQHKHNTGTRDSIIITFPGYGSRPGSAKYDYHHGIADIHISGLGWASIKLMADSSYIVTEYNIPDPDIKKGAINHIVWQTDAGRAFPFLKEHDLVIIILLEASAGLTPDLQLSFNIVELDNPINTEVSHINKPDTMLTFPVLTMSTYDTVLTGANPQYIRPPFNHPVLSMSIQVVDIPINSVMFIPFPFDDKRNYKIPLVYKKETNTWEIIFQDPELPMAELFSDKTTINFTKLTNPEPVLVITPAIELDTSVMNDTWQVNIWVIQRNICRVMSGMAGLAFAI